MLTYKENMRLSASLAAYLEAIFRLEQSSRVARAKDIAAMMNIQRASVTGALKTLAARGFINYSPYSYITLTTEGRDIAIDIIRKHALINEFFTDVLHLSPEAAEENARRVDHALDRAVMDKLARFLEFFKICPLNRESPCLKSYGCTPED
jgi:DtxR family Mn-dependent transcriptional regulator